KDAPDERGVVHRDPLLDEVTRLDEQQQVKGAELSKRRPPCRPGDEPEDEEGDPCADDDCNEGTHLVVRSSSYDLPHSMPSAPDTGGLHPSAASSAIFTHAVLSPSNRHARRPPGSAVAEFGSGWTASSSKSPAYSPSRETVSPSQLTFSSDTVM